MLQNVTTTPSRRSLEFGIYRDGDNNLDAIQRIDALASVAHERAATRPSSSRSKTRLRYARGLARSRR